MGSHPNRERLARSVLNLRTLGWTLAIVLAAIALGTIWKAESVWQDRRLSPDERLAALGNVFGGGTFALAVVASALALLAYWVALQRPRLVPRLSSDDIEKGVIHVGAGRPQANGERLIVRLGGYLRYGAALTLSIDIENTSDWSARNVAVKVSFVGIRDVPLPQGWGVAGHDLVTGEITALSWEGGADLAVHGRWPRPLPPILLSNALLEAPGTDCAVEIEVVAEGFRKSWRFPVRWTPTYEPEHTSRGAIEGYCGYPSSHVPEMRILALPAGPRPVRYRTDLPAGPSGKLRWYVIDNIEPGDYHVLAHTRTDPKVWLAYAVNSDRNSLGSVPVAAGQVTVGVEITDLFAGNLPPELTT